MKTYRRRPGVEFVEICGEYLLIATAEARGACPYATQINQSAAEYWQLLDRPYSADELIKRAAVVFGKEQKAVVLPVMAFLGKLKKSGYLIEEVVE